MTIRKRTWEILEVAAPGDSASRRFDIAMLTLILLNVVGVVLGSVQSVHAEWGSLLEAFEIFSVGVFTLEYGARLWSCTADDRFSEPVLGRLRHAVRGMSLVDLLAILPFYLPFLGADLRSVRILRLLRIVRIAKLGRYSSSLSLIKHVVAKRKEELVITTVFMAILLIVSSTLLFYCEYSAQPDTFSSIPATMWWAVATLTTVGYGDVYPVTALGKACASIIAILGIGMFALPTGILGAGFVEAVQRRRQASRACPHCGGELGGATAGWSRVRGLHTPSARGRNRIQRRGP